MRGNLCSCVWATLGRTLLGSLRDSEPFPHAGKAIRLRHKTGMSLALVLAVLLGGLAAPIGVFAKPIDGTSQHLAKHTSPNSCFWNVVASNKQNIVVNGANVGFYEAAILHNSCQSTTHAVDGEEVVTGGGCTSGRLQVAWWTNNTPQSGGDLSSSNIGPTNCSTTELFWQSGNYVGSGVNICVTAYAWYAGNPLSPNANVCKQF